ncbi:MAG: 50S ribosomal protein L9 [Verrucomicrobiota bacterium]
MAVEVILNTKIEGLGAEADIVKVRPGFARNFLFPRGMAAPATTASKKQVELLKKKRAQREAQELNDAQEQANKISKVKLNFTLLMGDRDKAFGSITIQDITDKLKAAGFEIDKKKIDLAKPIKTAGEHEVQIKIHSEVSAKVKIIVEAPVPEKTEVKFGKDKKGYKGKAKAEDEAPAEEKKSKKKSAE